MTVHAYKHPLYFVICSAVSWIRKKYYNYNSIFSIHVLKKYKQASLPLSFSVSKVFLNIEWNFSYWKQQRTANTSAKDNLGKVTLLALPFCCGEIITKQRQCAQTLHLQGFSTELFQEMDLRVRRSHMLLCAAWAWRDFLHKAHRAQQNMHNSSCVQK